jgi:hypothetical protein
VLKDLQLKAFKPDDVGCFVSLSGSRYVGKCLMMIDARKRFLRRAITKAEE